MKYVQTVRRILNQNPHVSTVGFCQTETWYLRSGELELLEPPYRTYLYLGTYILHATSMCTNFLFSFLTFHQPTAMKAGNTAFEIIVCASTSQSTSQKRNELHCSRLQSEPKTQTFFPTN